MCHSLVGLGVNKIMSKWTFFAVKSTCRRNGNFESRHFCNDDTADEMARWYSRLPKLVCGTIKPILNCCGVFSSFFAWCSTLWRSLSPPIRFGPRSPIWMPDDDRNAVCDPHAKVVAIIDTKTNKMCDVFIITPSMRNQLYNNHYSTPSPLLRKNRWNLFPLFVAFLFRIFYKTFLWFLKFPC